MLNRVTEGGEGGGEGGGGERMGIPNKEQQENSRGKEIRASNQDDFREPATQTQSQKGKEGRKGRLNMKQVQGEKIPATKQDDSLAPPTQAESHIVEMGEKEGEKGRWEGKEEEEGRMCTHNNNEQHDIPKDKRFPFTNLRIPKEKRIPATKPDYSRKHASPTQAEIEEGEKIEEDGEEKGKIEEEEGKTNEEGKIEEDWEEKGKIQEEEKEERKAEEEGKIDEEEEQYLDGGWGWMVVLGGAMVSLLQSLLVTSQGLTFISLLEKFPHLQTAVVCGTMALYNGCRLISGELCFLVQNNN